MAMARPWVQPALRAARALARTSEPAPLIAATMVAAMAIPSTLFTRSNDSTVPNAHTTSCGESEE